MFVLLRHIRGERDDEGAHSMRLLMGADELSTLNTIPTNKTKRDQYRTIHMIKVRKAPTPEGARKRNTTMKR